MKIKKKIVALSMSLLILGGTLTGVYAETSVLSGIVYNTVRHRNIPAGGGASYNTFYGSKKATNGTFATFLLTERDALLGNFGGLITSSKYVVTELVGMPLNVATLADEIGCSKGNTYFTVVTSSAVEPSNSCCVTMKFSADNLKSE